MTAENPSASEDLFHLIFRKHEAVMLLIEPESGRIVDANLAAEKFYGYSLAQIKEMCISDINILPPEQVTEERMRAAREERNYFIFPHKLASGEIRTVEVHSSPITLEGKPILFSIIHDITELKQAEQSLQARTRELKTLFDISTSLSLVQSETEILPRILTEGGHILDADAMAIILGEFDGVHLRVIAASGGLASNIGRQFKKEESLNAEILDSLQIHQIDDISCDPNLNKIMDGIPGFGPAIFTPLLSGENWTGVLLTVRKKGNPPFTSEATRLIIVISEMIGNSINRVRLYEETMRRLDRLQSLRAVDQVIASSLDLQITLKILLNHAVTQLNVDAAAVFLLHPYLQMLKFVAGQGFRTQYIENAEIHLGDNFAGRAVMERHPIFIFDPAEVEATESFAHLWAEEEFVNYVCMPLIAKGEVKGVMEVYRRSEFTPNPEWTEFFETLAGQAAITLDNAQLFDDLQRANMELAIAYDATIEGWSRAMDLRDKETEGHTLRVTELTIALARSMGVPDKEIINIWRGALLHDIGKMGVPDKILLKPAKLTDKEWETMRKHPVFALEMLEPIHYLRNSLDIPYCHHERWDGTGYPRGLKGEQIPLSARIFAVANVWDAIISPRPYRKKMAKKKAIDYIKEQSGKHFDPQVVDTFLRTIRYFDDL